MVLRPRGIVWAHVYNRLSALWLLSMHFSLLSLLPLYFSLFSLPSAPLPITLENILSFSDFSSLSPAIVSNSHNFFLLPYLNLLLLISFFLISFVYLTFFSIFIPLQSPCFLHSSSYRSPPQIKFFSPHGISSSIVHLYSVSSFSSPSIFVMYSS